MPHITIPPYEPITYTASAAQTDFPIPYPFFNPESVKVYRHDAGTVAEEYNLLVYTIDYIITGVENPNEGSDNAVIVLVSGATAGDLYTITRVMPFQRLTDYPNTSQPKGDSLNTDFDRLWIACQQTQHLIEKITGETSDNPSPAQIPNFPSPLANAVIKWDTSGNTFVNAAFPDQATDIIYNDVGVPFTAPNVQVALDETNIRIDGLAPSGDPLTVDNVANQGDIDAGTHDQVLDAELMKTNGLLQTGVLNDITNYNDLITAPSTATYTISTTAINRPSGVASGNYIAMVVGQPIGASRIVLLWGDTSSAQSYLMVRVGSTWQVRTVAIGQSDGTISNGNNDWISSGILASFGLGVDDPISPRTDWQYTEDTNKFLALTSSATNAPANAIAGAPAASINMKASDDLAVSLTIQPDENTPRIFIKSENTGTTPFNSDNFIVPVLVASGRIANADGEIEYRKTSDGYIMTEGISFSASPTTRVITFPTPYTSDPIVVISLSPQATGDPSGYVFRKTITSFTVTGSNLGNIDFRVGGY